MVKHTSSVMPEFDLYALYIAYVMQRYKFIHISFDIQALNWYDKHVLFIYDHTRDA